MKVGDLVRWRMGYSVPGVVLATKAALTSQPALAVLAYIPNLPGLEWFHENELDINESR